MTHHHHDASMLADRASAPLAAGLGGLDAIGLTAPLIHTLGYLVATCLIAVIVYEKVGLGILRRAWINVNVVWAGAMIVAALLTALL
jgi:hypothetical protein